MLQAAQLNWRNPGVVGRSDLESLLASDDPRDWVAISERLLGPPPPGFIFQPKHKAQVIVFALKTHCVEVCRPYFQTCSHITARQYQAPPPNMIHAVLDMPAGQQQLRACKHSIATLLHHFQCAILTASNTDTAFLVPADTCSLGNGHGARCR